MYTFIVILILIVCVLLSIVVLMQNSKGGGLAANFSAPTQVLGARKTTDVFEKATWILAGALVVLSLAATITVKATTGGSSEEQSIQTKVNINDNQVQNNAIQMPIQTPAPAEAE